MFRIIMPDGKRSQRCDRDKIARLHAKGRIPEGSEVEYRMPLDTFLSEASPALGAIALAGETESPTPASTTLYDFAEKHAIAIPPGASEEVVFDLIGEALRRQDRASDAGSSASDTQVLEQPPGQLLEHLQDEPAAGTADGQTPLQSPDDELLATAAPERMLKVLGDRRIPAVMISMEEDGVGLIMEVMEGRPSGREWQTRIQANKYFSNVKMVAAMIEMTRNQLVKQLR